MGFDTITNMAKQFAGNEQANKDPSQQQQENQSGKTGQDWADVGAAAQKAFTGYQADKAEGKGPDYGEIGGVAQKAFSAYNRDGASGEGEKQEADLADIGKGITVGFRGGSKGECAKGTGEKGTGDIKEDGEGKESQCEDGAECEEGAECEGQHGSQEKGQGKLDRGPIGEGRRTRQSGGLRPDKTQVPGEDFLGDNASGLQAGQNSLADQDSGLDVPAFSKDDTVDGGKDTLDGEQGGRYGDTGVSTDASGFAGTGTADSTGGAFADTGSFSGRGSGQNE